MRVLFALDESDYSSTGLQSLLGMMWTEEDELKILSIVDPFDETKNLEVEKDKAEILVENAVERVRSVHTRLTVGGEVLSGSPHDRLLDACTNWHADLLVIGANRGCSSSKLMLGKISGSLLESAPCSVLIVKDNDISSGGEYRNVLIPLDRKQCSEQSIQSVFDSKWPNDVTFHVVTVIEKLDEGRDFEDADPDFVEKLIAEHEELKKSCDEFVSAYAERLNEKFGQLRASWSVLEGHPRDEILRVAEELPAGLIVIGTQGRGFLDKFLSGSVSQTIASQSACSVEVVKGSHPEAA